MKIFLDFDDVLFNTRDFMRGFRGIFVKNGIEEDIFRESYKGVKKILGISAGYNFEEHVQFLKARGTLDEQRLREDVSVFLQDLKRYILADVKDFLNMKGAFLYLVSYGISDFQHKKIQGTQLDQFFEGVIVGDVNKGNVVSCYAKLDESIWFLDDREKFIREVKEIRPNVQTILIQRPEGRYHDEKSVYCDYEVKNLIEAKEIIIHNS